MPITQTFPRDKRNLVPTQGYTWNTITNKLVRILTNLHHCPQSLIKLSSHSLKMLSQTPLTLYTLQALFYTDNTSSIIFLYYFPWLDLGKARHRNNTIKHNWKILAIKTAEVKKEIQRPHQMNRTRFLLAPPQGKRSGWEKKVSKLIGRERKLFKNRNLTKSDSLLVIVLNLLAVANRVQAPNFKGQKHFNAWARTRFPRLIFNALVTAFTEEGAQQSAGTSWSLRGGPGCPGEVLRSSVMI